MLVAHRDAHNEAVEAADILGLFWRHPELAEEMPSLLDAMQQQYSQAADRLVVLGAELDGELR